MIFVFEIVNNSSLIFVFQVVSMIKHYLKIALRSLLKYKGSALINILGLAIGMTCFILIALYVREELSYDIHHEKADRVFRVAVQSSTVHRESATADTPYPLAPVLREEYPEFEKVGRLYAYVGALVEAGGKKIYEDLFYFAEPEFLEIFTIPTVSGAKLDALRQPNSVIITSSTAQKYFGDRNPIGETIRFNNRLDLAVTGVIRDLPANSHFHFDFLASFASVNKELIGANPNQWGMYFGNYTYALISPGADVTKLQTAISGVLNEKAGHGQACRVNFFFNR